MILLYQPRSLHILLILLIFLILCFYIFLPIPTYQIKINLIVLVNFHIINMNHIIMRFNYFFIKLQNKLFPLLMNLIIMHQLIHMVFLI